MHRRACICAAALMFWSGCSDSREAAPPRTLPKAAELGTTPSTARKGLSAQDDKLVDRLVNAESEAAFDAELEAKERKACRHKVLRALVGKESLSEVGDGMILVMINDWLKPEKHDQGYEACAAALAEIRAVYAELGTSPLLDEFFPRASQTDFYRRLGRLKGEQKVAHDVAEKDPLLSEIAQAKQSGDWSGALQCLEAQIK